MNCLQAKQLMSSYLDLAVTRDEMSALQSHMDSCGPVFTPFHGVAAHPGRPSRISGGNLRLQTWRSAFVSHYPRKFPTLRLHAGTPCASDGKTYLTQ